MAHPPRLAAPRRAPSQPSGEGCVAAQSIQLGHPRASAGSGAWQRRAGAVRSPCLTPPPGTSPAQCRHALPDSVSAITSRNSSARFTATSLATADATRAEAAVVPFLKTIPGWFPYLVFAPGSSRCSPSL
jgi:hypothetical protein